MPSPWTAGTTLPRQAGDLNWIPVDSSNVSRIAYAEDFRRLFIQFKSGATYAYEDVPKGVWEGFLAAPSKGQYVFYVIRRKGTDSQYAYSRIA